MNVNNICLKKGEKYVAFATESPQTVHGKLCTLSLAFLQDLWWEYYDAWHNPVLSPSQRLPIWVHLQVLTSLIINRYGWNATKKTPWRDRPYSTELSKLENNDALWQTYSIGSPDWKCYWDSHPEDQLKMLDWVVKKKQEGNKK